LAFLTRSSLRITVVLMLSSSHKNVIQRSYNL
jgi:hypothetical protein